LPEISEPVNLKAEILNKKIKPTSVRLSWTIDKEKAAPDHWTIERKFDVDNDTFEVIGKSYIEPQFFDRDVEIGNSYIYRIKSIDTLGRESDFFEARLNV